MANTVQRLKNQYVAWSGTGKQQTAKDAPLSNSDITTRDKCTIEVSEVVNRVTDFDCENVFVDNIRTKTRVKRVTFTYAALRPQIMARHAAYYFGATAAPTGTAVNEVQTLTRSGTVSGGTFTLSLTLEGRTGVTKPIPFDATAAAVQAALVKTGTTIGNLIKSGDVVVTGDWTAGIVITFQGRLQRANLPLPVVTSALTGASPGVNVAQTTAGDAKYFPFVRATSDVKPLTSFIIGDITSGVATEKYYNAVCESFEASENAGGDVSLKVSYLCNYEPEAVTGYTIPPCVNPLPLATSDCRIQINGAWETLDVFSETTTLNDNVPLDADTFGFDSIDPDILERGDQPTFTKTGVVFGVPTDPLGIIVAAEGKAEYITHFGMPGDRFSLIIPALAMLPQSNSRQFAGARNRRVIAFDGTPTRDGSNAPIRAEYFGSQSQSFLLT